MRVHLTEETLAVGNDVSKDMAAKAPGMRVFFLISRCIHKENTGISEYTCGDFKKLMEFIKNEMKDAFAWVRKTSNPLWRRVFDGIGVLTTYFGALIEREGKP